MPAMYHRFVRRPVRSALLSLLLPWCAAAGLAACRSNTEFPWGGGGEGANAISSVSVRTRVDGIDVRWNPVRDATGYDVCVLAGTTSDASACGGAVNTTPVTAGTAAFVSAPAGGPATVFVAPRVGGTLQPFGQGLGIRTFPVGHAGYRPDPLVAASHGGANGSLFGGRMASAGFLDADPYEDLIVGAPYHGNGDEGRIYLFRGGPEGLRADPQIVENPLPAKAFFGISVGPSRGYGGAPGVLVGARGVESGGAGTDGVAYVFLIDGTALQPALTPLDNTAHTNGDAFGYASAAYDPLGNGASALAIGAFQDDSAISDGGCVHSFGSANWSHCPNDGTTFLLGRAVANLGDVDGVVGEELGVFWGPPFTDPGVRIYTGGGSAGNEPTNQDLVQPVGGQTDFGFTMAGLDFDGDGRGEFAISARREATDRGTIHLYRRTANQLPTVPVHSYAGGAAAGGRLGSSMAAGDVNGDGYDDLLVGAPRASTGGAVFLWLGGPAGLGTDGAWSVTIPQGVIPEFGNGVALVDLNGDGSKDVVAGAAGTSSGAACEIYWYPGPPVRGPEVSLLEGSAGIEAAFSDAPTGSSWICRWTVDGTVVTLPATASCTPDLVTIPPEAHSSTSSIELEVTNEDGPSGHALLIRAAAPN